MLVFIDKMNHMHFTNTYYSMKLGRIPSNLVVPDQSLFLTTRTCELVEGVGRPSVCENSCLEKCIKYRAKIDKIRRTKKCLKCSYESTSGSVRGGSMVP